MIDYGLFALIVVILVLVFLAFHAWRGVKADAERIFESEARTKADLDLAFGRIETIRALADRALVIAEAVEKTHYKSLLSRIDEAEATSLRVFKQFEVFENKIASLGGRMSSLQRWRKEAAEPEDTGGGGEQLEAFPVAPVPPPVNQANGHFGRIVGRKGG